MIRTRQHINLRRNLVELSKNTSASVRDHTSSDNIRSCNPGVFDSGATYRLELQCYHLAVKSERQNLPPSIPIERGENVVQCKGGHPRGATKGRRRFVHYKTSSDDSGCGSPTTVVSNAERKRTRTLSGDMVVFNTPLRRRQQGTAYVFN